MQKTGPMFCSATRPCFVRLDMIDRRRREWCDEGNYFIEPAWLSSAVVVGVIHGVGLNIRTGQENLSLRNGIMNAVRYHYGILHSIARPNPGAFRLDLSLGPRRLACSYRPPVPAGRKNRTTGVAGMFSGHESH